MAPAPHVWQERGLLSALPLPVRGHRGRQGGEEEAGADGLRQAVRVQVVPQILFDAGQGEDDAPARQFLAQLVDGVQGGDVDLHIGLGVEDEPADRVVLFVDGGHGPAAEVLRVGEEEGES